MLFYDLNYWVYMLPAFAVVMFAQYYVKSTYRRWSKVVTLSRMTGAQAAQRLINTGRLYDVNVEAVSGKMTDHYDPRQKVLRLSQGVYQTAYGVDLHHHRAVYAVVRVGLVGCDCLLRRCPVFSSNLTY